MHILFLFSEIQEKRENFSIATEAPPPCGFEDAPFDAPGLQTTFIHLPNSNK